MELYDHQKEFVNKNITKGGLWWEPGVGKTLAAIKWADKKINKKHLVICPKSLKQNWINELSKNANNFLNFQILTKEEFKKLWNKLEVIPDNIIIDEAHHFFGIKSALYKNLIKYLKNHTPSGLLLLTGTPYLSTPWNVYAAAKILGREWSYVKFRQEYFINIRMGNRFIPQPIPNAKDKLIPLLRLLGKTKRLDECTDVPEQIFKEEYFDFNSKQKSKIKEIEKNNLVSIARWTKIHQVCGGTLKSDGYNEDWFCSNEKLKRLKEYININKKVAIVCKYNNEIYQIHQTFYDTRKIRIINGRTENVQKIINEINEIDDCIVLINAAKSEGYNLWSVPLMIFYSHSFSLKDYEQMKRRILRINKVKKNLYISFIIKDSIDNHVFKSLKEKENFQIELYSG